MAHRIASFHENKPLRDIVGTVGVLAALVVFTEMTLRTIAPITFIFVGMMAHDLIDETHDLPEGTNWLIYGGAVFVAGVSLAVIEPTLWVGGFVALAGLWFVFDGATTIRYEPSQTAHVYVSGLDDEIGEALLRMQTLNVVYRTLRDASEPRSVAELATDLDLTESRVESALRFLESKGRVEQVGDQYRAEPPQWGRLTPVVQFLVWLPRRVIRPFSWVVANA